MNENKEKGRIKHLDMLVGCVRKLKKQQYADKNQIFRSENYDGADFRRDVSGRLSA